MKQHGALRAKHVTGKKVIRRAARCLLVVIVMQSSVATQTGARSNADARDFTPARYHFIQQNDSANDFAASPLPKDVRGYKVERVQIKIKNRAAKEKDKNGGQASESASGSLVKFGEPRVVSFSLFKIELDFPVEIAAVEQRGRIDRLVFEAITINGVPVEIADYARGFELPNERPLRLPEPLRVTVTTPRALLATFDELRQPKNDWKIVGRVYALGRFKKLFFTFRRAVPVEFDLSVPNPIYTEKN